MPAQPMIGQVETFVDLPTRACTLSETGDTKSRTEAVRAVLRRHQMELRHLRYFVAVVAEGSFTRAADKLNMAQPPLSRQIQQLERDMGVPLLDRRGRPLTTTESGSFFYEQALHVLDRIEMMTTMTRHSNHVYQGPYRIGFVGSILCGPLPDLVRRLRLSRTNIEVRMLEMTTLQQVAALKKNQIDIGFGRLHFDDVAIKQEVLREEPLVVALPIGHRLLNFTGALKLKDLVAETLIVYPKAPRPNFVDQILGFFRDRQLEPSGLHEVTELQSALGLTAAAVGVCLVPKSVQRQRREDLVYRDIADKNIVSPIIMTFCANDESNEEMNKLRDTIHKLYDEERT